MWAATILFTLAGLILGNILGGLIGFFLGRFVDRRLYQFFFFPPKRQAELENLFFKTTFYLLGALAKADGHVSQAEINHTEALMSRMGLTPEHRKQAIGFFKAGAAPDFDLSLCVQQFNQKCGRQLGIKRVLLSYLIGIALADGGLDPAEESLLRGIAGSLQLDGAVFEQLIRMIKAQRDFGQQRRNQSRPQQHTNQLAIAYEALGVQSNASDSEVKRAYRKLISENHPDKLIGQGVPEDMIKMATERSQEIRQAYELIMQSRGR